MVARMANQHGTKSRKVRSFLACDICREPGGTLVRVSGQYLPGTYYVHMQCARKLVHESKLKATAIAAQKKQPGPLKTTPYQPKGVEKG